MATFQKGADIPLCNLPDHRVFFLQEDRCLLCGLSLNRTKNLCPQCSAVQPVLLHLLPSTRRHIESVEIDCFDDSDEANREWSIEKLYRDSLLVAVLILLTITPNDKKEVDEDLKEEEEITLTELPLPLQESSLVLISGLSKQSQGISISPRQHLKVFNHVLSSLIYSNDECSVCLVSKIGTESWFGGCVAGVSFEFDQVVKMTALGDGPFCISSLPAYISGDEDVKSRAALLKIRGLGVCRCTRCEWERGNGESEEKWSVQALKNLGDFYMQAQRYFEGRSVYKKLVYILSEVTTATMASTATMATTAAKDTSNSSVELGDAINCLGASCLECGEFDEAYRAWVDGKKMVPSYQTVVDMAEKLESYSINNPLCNNSFRSFAFEINTMHQNKIFLTPPGLVEEKTCKKIIETCENHQWTTTRHYSVPTTDLPVHRIPSVLQWFNELCLNKLGPLVEQVWGESSLRIMDAFIVKYCFEGGQIYLPKHRDQSEYSFTIALNNSFGGGGTYFTDLNRVISPGAGGICGFRGGELEHSGHNISEGIRYICVVFAYGSGTKLGSNKGKKRNIIEIDHVEGADGRSFSFGFEM